MLSWRSQPNTPALQLMGRNLCLVQGAAFSLSVEFLYTDQNIRKFHLECLSWMNICAP